MNILIFEDEIFNYKLLVHELQQIDKDYNIIGPISTVEEGRLYLSTHDDTDLIIADIQLNDGLSFDALSYAPDNVPIIFTTAYEEHALRAFEFNSLSYLLKPIDEEQLAQALKRAARLERYDHHKVFSEISQDDSHRHCFMVKTFNGERRVPMAMVRYVVSDHKTTYLYLLDDMSYAIGKSLSELAHELDPRRARQVNRKFIVPHDQVRAVERLSNGRIRLVLYGNDSPEIIVSRDRRKEILDWLNESH